MARKSEKLLIDKFEERYLYTMASFQFLENALNGFLTISHVLVKFELPDEIPYENDNSVFADMPLGNLIKEVKRFIDDESILVRLDELRKKRNEFAHQKLTSIFFDGSEESFGTMADLDEMNEVFSDAMALHDQIVAMTRKRWELVREHLESELDYQTPEMQRYILNLFETLG